MILPEHAQHFDRLRPYMKPAMLMLGNQENKAGYQFPCDYLTLDPDGGQLQYDLNEPIENMGGQFETVFNLGTLEHVWDVHQAYLNCARVLRVGGHFLGHSPVAGYEGHGIHVTDWKYIRAFLEANGFEIQELWFSEQNGRNCDVPSRNCGRSIILWFAAKKLTGAQPITKPQQIYKNGQKS